MEERTPTLQQTALILAERASDPAAKSRGATYQRKIGNDDQCPYCWVQDGIETVITPVGRSSDDESDPDDDHWKCKVRHGVFAAGV